MCNSLLVCLSVRNKISFNDKFRVCFKGKTDSFSLYRWNVKQKIKECCYL